RHTRWPRDWSSDVCSSDLIHRDRFLKIGCRFFEVGIDKIDFTAVDVCIEIVRIQFYGPVQSFESLFILLLTNEDCAGSIVVARRSEERRVGKEGRSGWWGY